MSDPFELQRFVQAQDGVISTALEELRAGAKCSHWMWFVFPQLRGLGRSSTAQFYGLTSLDEARAYLDHPVLGSRLMTATEIVLQSQAGSLRTLFGAPDDLKLVSSMTLFALAQGQDGGDFQRVLDRWNGGRRDPATLSLLSAA